MDEKGIMYMARRFWETLSEFIVLAVIAFVLAFGIRTAVAEPRLVPTGSMDPTIAPGDRIFTVKALYYFEEPHRGDIVVFKVPKQVNSDPDAAPFVKRLIGLPGDTVEVRDGVLYVNGKAYKVAAARTPQYSYGPVKVKEGMLFVLGDNRNQSYDSHEWGFVPEENVIAKAVCVFWPLDHLKVLK
ncbi:MAG: signal peptidase I [Candidatus Aquicultor secundus]|uniref:Signal peptidase I n=1 Tax=Candidatus Aquicultor secundus TaxID=1973895 RepID=A0A2M7T5F4_9ACTN|nr:signal peptidase I [Candidatus Aquicultor secundus]NCO66577.1 signal peptidase I [Solirubrobacter sp.]OIO85540.1 MAG: signal peptidase I [Candidatus Aquicultor secundus]PIU27403.1 MAG: signal peptidase I [Candidatus Aquicultor secundus]PIW22458.1 MAG: signal peptidase I [Candidatus Aquicultor secundus]PIX52173.1 MAG: signal peptidase I [Candidatus Aquicultor secundus]